MAKERGPQVGGIESVLEMALAQQRSGLLRVECIQDGRVEVGEIYFLAGQLIYARAGTRLGQEALSYLLNWRNVHLSFVADASRPQVDSEKLKTGNTQALPRSLTPRRLEAMPGVHQQERNLSGTNFPLDEGRIPRKTRPEQDGLARPLTRRQRLIYFLVNGKRTIADLARTAGKTASEVDVIIGELMAQDLVGD